MKALTQMYKDSLQRQSESFNELLNKEIESSKDTIYVESNNRSIPVANPIALTNWRHFLILFLALALVVILSNWRSQQLTIQNLQQEVKQHGADRNKLEQQIGELQNLNLKLTRIEKEQRMSSMTKNKIFSIISHDLRSPINTISGLLNILGAKMATVGDIELRNLVREVNTSNERLTHFLDDLLKWSMSQMGQLKPEIVKMDIKRLVQENYALVKPRLKAKNIFFKASIPSEVAVYADVNMLRLILRNLISNSIKFTGDNGNISVELKRGDEGRSIIEVADDGVGMSDEKLSQLFEFKGSGINGGNRPQGTGLGLLLCKEFVELNRGAIEVTSQPGKGTVFSISLPDHPWELA
jgi:signal transduction histidine kinase